MNKDTPRTNDIIHASKGHTLSALSRIEQFARDLERELNAARAEIERIDVSGIHTCHNNCQRWTCVLRRERNLLLETLTDVDLCLEDINFPADGFIRSYIKKSLTKITGEKL